MDKRASSGFSCAHFSTTDKVYNSILTSREYVERSISSFSVNTEDLRKIIPKSMDSVDGDLVVIFEDIKEVDWLMGRSYNRLSILAKVALNGEDGLFTLISWEDDPNSVVIGRDMLGIPKFHCNFEKLKTLDGEVIVARQWGKVFLTMQLACRDKSGRCDSNFKEMTEFNIKYLPQTISPFSEAGASYITRSPCEGLELDTDFNKSCKEIIALDVPVCRFSQAPVQYRYINKLGSLLGAAPIKSSGYICYRNSVNTQQTIV